ncbi:hypothetical protein [Pseudomonas fluorescens]|uniref:Uncharacterized protein n=1 Tax=Pseudomonas fluorescens TaxID=294 RepID=A0A0F4TRU2_PSEFL|nr:hypothetical protein [Pseudomonas fluorescens]KJZ46092.1 hypothetical protein VC35_13320 [Pseudomonas fluorescens]
MHAPSSSRLVGVVVFAVLLVGCGSWLQDKVKRLVDGAFPPVDYASAQTEAVQRSLPELEAVTSPSLLLNVPAEELEKGFAAQLKTAEVKGITIENAKIEAGPQGFMLSADVSGTLPEPKGTFKATVKGWVTVSVADNVATLKPGLSSATLTSLDLDGWFSWGGDAAASAINSVLKDFISNANSQIKPIEYKFDPTQVGLSQPIEIKLPNDKTVILPEVKLGKVAVLVSPLGLHLLADLESASAATPPATGTCDKYDCYAEAFWVKADKIKPGLKRGTGGIYLADAFLSKLLTPAFPPIELADMRLDALQNLVQALNFNGQVALGASISAPRLAKALKEAMVNLLPATPEATLGEPVIELGEQTIEVEVPVSGKIDSAKISYKGKIRAGGVIASTAESLYYRVALVGLQLESVEHEGGPISPAAFIGSINGLVAQLLPYINGALDKQPISLPLPKIKPVSVATTGVQITPAELTIPPPSGVLLIPRLDKSGLRVLVVEGVGVAQNTVSGMDISAERAISGSLKPEFNRDASAQWFATPAVQSIALIITKRRINGPFGISFDVPVISTPTPAQPTPPPAPAPVPGPAPGQTPEDYANMLFQQMWATALPDQAQWAEGMPDIRAAAATSWIVGTVNTILQHNQIAIDVPFDSGITHYDTGKIRLAGQLEANCAAERNCSRGDCPLASCSTNSCDWSCRRHGPFNTSWDDPFCKAGETACNVRAEAERGACNVRANADQTACNVAEEAKRGACNIQKEAEILGCNIAKETVAAIKQIDGIGTANGDVRAAGGAAIRSPILKFNRGDSVVSLQMDAAANITMSGDIYFTPYDIGHILACPFKGRAAIEVHGSIPMKTYTITSTIKDGGAGQDGSHQLQMEFNSIPVKGSLSPAPVDAFLTQNPQIFLTCSPVVTGPLAAAALLGKVQAFVPGDILGAIEKAIPDNQELGFAALKAVTAGQIDVTAPIPSIQVTVPKLEAVIPGGNVSLEGVWKDGTLVFSGS